jgi:putative metalloprotease
MFKKISGLLAIIFVATAASASVDLGGMLGAAKDLTSAATLSDADVKKIAADAAKASDGKNKLAPADNALVKRLDALMKGMKPTNAPKLSIKVYLKDEVNAFAMADGSIRVYSGLMNAMTDDEIRYVLGHEIGHVALGHTKKALQLAYAASGVRQAAASSGNDKVATVSDSALGDLAEKLINAQFSQSQESDADEYAVKFMKANKRDAHAAVSALRKLEKLSGNAGGALSSHPKPGDRAAAVEKSL